MYFQHMADLLRSLFVDGVAVSVYILGGRGWLLWSSGSNNTESEYGVWARVWLSVSVERKSSRTDDSISDSGWGCSWDMGGWVD
jgi:hypothetical protein